MNQIGHSVHWIRYHNNDGVWSTENAELSIEILPPFWKTLWFQGLVLLLILIVVYTIYYFRIKRLLAIERMKLRIASDLHDEVGSGLSGIALTSDILEQQFKKGDIKPQLLSRITKNARNLAATLDDIVWLINPGKETLEDFLLKTKRKSLSLSLALFPAFFSRLFFLLLFILICIYYICPINKIFKRIAQLTC